MRRLTCSFLAGVLCPTAAGSCSGWFWGEAGSAAALLFPFSASFFACGCLASESVPDSVVMVNHTAVEGKSRVQEKTLSQSTVYEMIKCLFKGLSTDELPSDANSGMPKYWLTAEKKTKQTFLKCLFDDACHLVCTKVFLLK